MHLHTARGKAVWKGWASLRAAHFKALRCGATEFFRGKRVVQLIMSFAGVFQVYQAQAKNKPASLGCVASGGIRSSPTSRAGVSTEYELKRRGFYDIQKNKRPWAGETTLCGEYSDQINCLWMRTKVHVFGCSRRFQHGSEISSVRTRLVQCAVRSQGGGPNGINTGEIVPHTERKRNQ